MIVLSDTTCQAAEGDPPNLKVCRRGEWNDRRMLIETVLSMLTVVSPLKQMLPRVWAYVHARLAFTMAAFHVVVQWHGILTDEQGFVPLAIAELSL